MMDLTKTAPRSVKETMLGIVQLARATDKAKAAAHGRLGDVVRTARDDSGIEAYAKTFVTRKDPRNIEAFNKKWLSAVPTGESLKHFEELRATIAPDRTDVVSWADLLDLDEGREVPRHEPIYA
jgi:hypothetical protein